MIWSSISKLIDLSMDRIIDVFDNAEGVIKPETLFYYGACAVLITVFVNWALAMMLIILKPFTCAGILMAFLRPDLVQSLMQEEHLRVIADKLRTVFRTLLGIVLQVGEQLRSKLM